MKATSNLTKVNHGGHANFAFDTSFVLFFLAVDLGQNLAVIRIDTAFLILTLAAVAILPYFIAPEEKPEFGSWLLGRGLIVGFALVAGLMFRQTLGVVLPEAFRFLPLTLLIVTAMFSCYVHFYGLFRLRLTK